MVRTIIDIKDERVWKAFKHFADLNNLKVSEALEQVLKEYLKELIKAEEKYGKKY